MPDREILCVGEVLWDALPAGLFLGGAPFNVACHLHELGVPVAFASRVGEDALGEEIIRRLAYRGISTTLLQEDSALQTGFVRVELDTKGSPDFTIVEPSAWDAIQPEDELLDRAANAHAVVFGSLCQRREPSRSTIQRIMSAAKTLVFDVNLRPPFDGRSVVEESLEAAHVVKLNEDELSRLSAWFTLGGASDAERAAALADQFGCRTVCVTRGEHGAGLWQDGSWYEHGGYAVTVADTVGSGDAFLAAFLKGWLAEDHPGTLLELANATGAYVASKDGATPSLDPDGMDKLRNG